MKKFAALLSGAAILISTTAFASVAPSKIAIGSLTPGMSVNDLIAACGQPNSKHGDDWIYDGLKVEIDDHRPNIVEKIVTHSGRFTTPDGVAVGQDASILNSTFGKADDVDVEKHGVEYEYFSTDRTKKIEFTVVNNIITKISCKIID